MPFTPSKSEQAIRARVEAYRQSVRSPGKPPKIGSYDGKGDGGGEDTGPVQRQSSARLSALGFEYFGERAGRQAVFMKDHLAYLTHRRQRWASSFPQLEMQPAGRFNPAGKRLKPSASQIKRFCRKGIPMHLRAHVWVSVSGAGAKIESNPGYYDRMLKDSAGEKWKEQIKLDLHRTFPDNVQFRPDGCDKQLQLGRVLQAYSAHNPTVGYCQGMNYVAGLLLLVMNGVEEQTFWLFDAMVSLLPPNQYNENMVPIQAECATFVRLAQEEFPELAAALDERGALDILPVIVVKWFLSAFVDTLPEETVLRVWDVVFTEGWKALYRVGLAMLLCAFRSGELETHDSSTVLEFLSNIGWSAFDCNALLLVAFEEIESGGKLSRSSIAKAREVQLKDAST